MDRKRLGGTALFEDLLEQAFRGELRESRNIEFKRSYSLANAEHRHKIVKAVLAFSNVRDGGFMILGVENENGNPVGMLDNDYELLNGDHILAEVNNFADPFVELQLEKIEREGMKFAIIRVFEFAELPVICKRQGEANLRQGVMYTRGTRIPESVAIPSQTEMREIIELAVDKGIRHFETRRLRQNPQLQLLQQISDTNKFEDELGGL